MQKWPESGMLRGCRLREQLRETELRRDPANRTPEARLQWNRSTQRASFAPASLRMEMNWRIAGESTLLFL